MKDEVNEGEKEVREWRREETDAGSEERRVGCLVHLASCASSLDHPFRHAHERRAGLLGLVQGRGERARPGGLRGGVHAREPALQTLDLGPLGSQLSLEGLDGAGHDKVSREGVREGDRGRERKREREEGGQKQLVT